MSAPRTEPPGRRDNRDETRIRGSRWGAALAIAGSLLAILGIIVVSQQVQLSFTGPGACFAPPCPGPTWRSFPVVPPALLEIWAALALAPLLTLLVRRGFLIAAATSGVLAGVGAAWAFWVEQGENPANPVALFQGTIAVCVGACLGFAGYWTLRRAYGKPVESSAMESARGSNSSART
jgi:hypothetical protein